MEPSYTLHPRFTFHVFECFEDLALKLLFDPPLFPLVGLFISDLSNCISSANFNKLKLSLDFVIEFLFEFIVGFSVHDVTFGDPGQHRLNLGVALSISLNQL